MVNRKEVLYIFPRRFRHFTPYKRARRSLTHWNHLLYSIRRFQDMFAFSVVSTFYFGQTSIFLAGTGSTDRGKNFHGRGCSTNQRLEIHEIRLSFQTHERNEWNISGRLASIGRHIAPLRDRQLLPSITEDTVAPRWLSLLAPTNTHPPCLSYPDNGIRL